MLIIPSVLNVIEACLLLLLVQYIMCDNHVTSPKTYTELTPVYGPDNTKVKIPYTRSSSDTQSSNCPVVFEDHDLYPDTDPFSSSYLQAGQRCHDAPDDQSTDSYGSHDNASPTDVDAQAHTPASTSAEEHGDT